MPRNNKNVVLTPLDMCRICLNDRRQVFIDVMAPNEPHLIQHVRDYYRVDITGNDGKSTKLCQCCVEYIDVWQGHIERAKGSQLIVNYLAEKRYMSSSASTSQTTSKRSLSVLNKKMKSTSRRSKKRKRSSSIPEHEIPSTSTSNNMILSPLESESIQQSTSASIQCPSINTQYVSDLPSTSYSNKIIPCTSTSSETVPCASTSTEIVPCASTSTETVTRASTSTAIIPCASTTTDIFTHASTSTAIVPYISTSKEIVPYASTSAEIVSSYTVNETSPIGDAVWYTDPNEKSGPESQSGIFSESNSFKVEHVCLFCTYQDEKVMGSVYKHILFCPKHSEPFACVIENCHCVFPSKGIFISHYRTHLNLNSSTFLCRECFSVLTCSRRTLESDHTHQNISALLKCCSLTFPTMASLVLHKVVNHCAVVVLSNNRSYTLQKQNLNIKKTELDDIRVGLDEPGTVPCNKIIKDNGSFTCYTCPRAFNNIKEFINHTKVKHNNLITEKDTGIKLCPLCDNSFFNEEFIEHVDICTDTLKVGQKSLNNYGCVYCRIIFTGLSRREIRNHFLYCKSFKLCIINNKLHHKCNSCSFTSTDDYLCLIHANSNCIYFQLKMRYAMGPDENKKILQRMEFIKQNTEQQEDENCTNNEELLSSSNTVCNTGRQRLLKNFKYYCNNCENLFFDRIIFVRHLTETGSFCRLQSLIYCQKCLTEFNTLEEYHSHLPSMPEASPLLLSIKEELFGKNNENNENNDEDDNLSMDVVRTNQNYCYVKVEMNDETFIQKQEPLNFDEPSDLQYQEQEQEVSNIDLQYQEQEQEVSNIDLNNCYACPEVDEQAADHIYMQCEVEDKTDLNKLLLENME